MGGEAGSKEKRGYDLRHYCNSRHYSTFFNYPGSLPVIPGDAKTRARMLVSLFPAEVAQNNGKSRTKTFFKKTLSHSWGLLGFVQRREVRPDQIAPKTNEDGRRLHRCSVPSPGGHPRA